MRFSEKMNFLDVIGHTSKLMGGFFFSFLSEIQLLFRGGVALKIYIIGSIHLFLSEVACLKKNPEYVE